MIKNIIIGVLIALLIMCTLAYNGAVYEYEYLKQPIVERPIVDMKVLRMIESSNNPEAYNVTTGATGLYQITPICLEDYNNFHPAAHYTHNDLYDAKINTKIATWYLRERIPAMLKHYGIHETPSEVLISWNAGISYAKVSVTDYNTKLPSETRNLLFKYYLMEEISRELRYLKGTVERAKHQNKMLKGE